MNLPLNTGIKKSNIMGESVWNWKSIDLPSYSGNTGINFAEDTLTYATECDSNSITKIRDRINFDLNPTAPSTPGGWCTRDYNMRAEIRTNPWQANNPIGTEEWYGWDYQFGNDYIIDVENTWLFFQIHNGVTGYSPPISITIGKSGRKSGSEAGTIFIENAANSENKTIYDYENTGIIPKAGQKLNIVVHVVWGLAVDGGMLEVWIDNVKVYDKPIIDTVYDEDGHRHGGNAKWGIYYWNWASLLGVNASANQGISHIQTSLGIVRQITRADTDPDYLVDAYDLVYPGDGSPGKKAMVSTLMTM